uniref:hypothetical protein n=1 Tax=Bartonella heixiaziensis TaxID=1461000 RepID=UPI0039088C46
MRDLEDVYDYAAALAFQEGFCCEGEWFLITIDIFFGALSAVSLLHIALYF